MILTTENKIIYTASKIETVIVKVWNIGKGISQYSLNNIDYVVDVCGERLEDPHQVIELELNEGETIKASSLEKNTIEIEM